MKTNIVLIGFMGAGKTTVGQLLAERLGKEFIELDSLIEQKAGKSIPDIFQQDGEIAFRELEIEVTREVAGRKNAVIACGGGLVLNRINIDRLKKEGTIVYLTVAPRIILKRVSNDETRRPLLDVPDPARTIHELLKFRKPFYQRAADITVNTSKLSVDLVVYETIRKLKGEKQLSPEQKLLRAILIEKGSA